MLRYDDKIYQREIIKQKVAQNSLPIPQEISYIRQLEQKVGYHSNMAKLFYNQAKYLENYEDNLETIYHSTSYTPVYKYFTNIELRSYFTWRTRLRHGQLEKSCLSFAKLYVSELLNLIGCTDPIDGYNKIKEFNEQYSLLDDALRDDFNDLLHDFVIFYNLDKSLLPPSENIEFQKAYFILSNLDKHSPKEIAQAFFLVSTYKIEKSKVYKQKLSELELVVSNVLTDLSKNYHGPRSNWIIEYFGSILKFYIRLFNSAYVFDQRRNCTFDYEISPNYIYHNINGSWQLTIFNDFNRKKRLSGKLLRLIDSLMREFYHFTPIKIQGIDSGFVNFVKNSMTQALNQPKKITINHQALADIRENATYTMDRLMTEEESFKPEVEVNSSQAPKSSDLEEKMEQEEDQILPYNLTQDEWHYLQGLFTNEDKSWIRAKELMGSILIDSINEKLFDLFNDNVLDETGIIPDYLDDLKNMLSK